MKNLIIFLIPAFLFMGCNETLYEVNKNNNNKLSLVDNLEDSKDNLDPLEIDFFLERLKKLNNLSSLINILIGKLEILKKPFENLPKTPFSTLPLTPQKQFVSNVGLQPNSILSPIDQLQEILSSLINIKEELNGIVEQINYFLNLLEKGNKIIKKIPFTSYIPGLIKGIYTLSTKTYNVLTKTYVTLNDKKNKGCNFLDENIKIIQEKINLIKENMILFGENIENIF